jgi:hypothetical protein
MHQKGDIVTQPRRRMQRTNELSDDFILNEIISLNNAANGLVQTIILVMGAYIVFAWALIERFGEHEAEMAQKMGVAVIANTTSVTSWHEVISLLFTDGFIFYSIYVAFILLVPLGLWAWAIISVRISKEPFMDLDLSSDKLRSIFKQRHNDYNQGLVLSLLGFLAAVVLIAFLAGIISDKF